MATRIWAILTSRSLSKSKWLNSTKSATQAWFTNKWTCDSFNTKMVRSMQWLTRVRLTQSCAATARVLMQHRCYQRFTVCLRPTESTSAFPMASSSNACTTSKAVTSIGPFPTILSPSPPFPLLQWWVLSKATTATSTGSTLWESKLQPPNERKLLSSLSRVQMRKWTTLALSLGRNEKNQKHE